MDGDQAFDSRSFYRISPTSTAGGGHSIRTSESWSVQNALFIQASAVAYNLHEDLITDLPDAPNAIMRDGGIGFGVTPIVVIPVSCDGAETMAKG